MPDHPFNDAIRAWAELVGAMAWPLAVFLLVRLFLKLFPEEVRDLLKRIRKTVGGTVFAAQVQQTTDSSKSELALLAETGPGAEFDATIAQYRYAFTIEVEDAGKKSAMLGESVPLETRERRLRTLAAVAWVIATFERVDATIFGSQLDLLAFLNVQPDGVVGSELYKRFYQPAATKNPEFFADYSFDQYMSYLINNVLVLSNNDRFSITVRGKDFLTWRVHESRPPRRG